MAWSIVIFSSFVRVHESTNNDLFLSFVQFIVLDPYISTLWGGSKETPPEIQDKIETASLAWTPKILVNGIGSILTLGSKGGYITLWHVTNPKDVRCVHSSRLSEDSWVTQLSWSPWMVENGRHVSILAYALSNGEVNARKVTFDTSDPLANIEISEDIIAAGNQSAHPCTAPEKPTVLAFSKHNRIYVWRHDTQKILSWRVPIAKPVANISWNERNDGLFVFFMDGKHGVVRVLENSLELNDEYTEFVQENIIAKCHVQNTSNVAGGEEEDNDDDDDDEDGGTYISSKLQLHIIAGSRALQGSLLSFVYYVTSPFQMEFQREKYQSSTVAFPKIMKDFQHSAKKYLFKRLEHILHVPGIALIINPAAQFWELLLYCGEYINSEESASLLMQELLSILTAPATPAKDRANKFLEHEALMGSVASPEEKLEIVLFDDPSRNADRACIYIWSRLQTASGMEVTTNALKASVATAEKKVRRHQIKCNLNLFFKYTKTNDITVALEECDRTFLLVLADSVLLFHKEDKDLVLLAEKLYSVFSAQFPASDVRGQLAALKAVKAGLTEAKDTSFDSERETCPACGAGIKLEHEDYAACTNGHTWPRCAATSLIISEFRPRTCQGCGRKSLKCPEPQLDSALLPSSGASTWLGITLRAAMLCGFCGERFFVALRKKT
ncbi:hypothetical protein BG006_009704 [Podila minutissima]|uniref:Transcription factor IIIC putative zinc-finger domain-containing protein n=1 Tax=Podila minutissima TaxID=64525 RepID=A0A9P5VQ03_9FUNG|nr:hypothetical protein BG006_009704 [Podila minutissima]